MSTNSMRCWLNAFIVVLSVVPVIALAQSRSYQPRLPKPEIDVISSKPNSAVRDSSRVDVYFAVPYRLLDFLYAGDKYVADYSTIIQITDSATDRLVLDRYQTYSVVEDLDRHELRTRKGIEMADAEQLSLQLAPGPYTVRLMIRDLSSHHQYDTDVTVTVRAFAGVLTEPIHPELSDPIVYRERKGMRILPAIGGDVGSVDRKSSGVFALLYNAPDSIASAVATVRGADAERPELVTSRLQHIASAAAPIFLPMDFSELWMGSYDLDLYLLPKSFDTALATVASLQRAAFAHVTRPIHVSVMHGVPIAQADLDQAIDQLRIIATIWEWDSLTSAQTAIEKREAIFEFWRKHDPSPTEPGNVPMEVFYRRIEYANAHFAYGGTPGWNSDRGRVLVALGQPDYIDSHPYEANQKPYEVWEYTRLGTRFYFVDQYLLGDYRLMGAGPPQGTFECDRD